MEFAEFAWPALWLGFVLGILMGSYLNVVIFRFGTDRSSLSGRSRCLHCSRELAAWELVPVLSYLFLRGRCSSCKKPISWRYPVIELVSGLGTGLLLAVLGLEFGTWALVAAWWLAIAIFWIDIDQMVVPDGAVIGLGIAALAWQISQSAVVDGLLGGLAMSLAIVALILATRGQGMGWGDATLAFALGLLLGWPLALVGLFFAVIIGAIFGAVLLMTRRAGRKDAIPFAPFLLLGATLAMIWGREILDWYLGVSQF